MHHIAPVRIPSPLPVPAFDPSWTGARTKPGSEEQSG